AKKPAVQENYVRSPGSELARAPAPDSLDAMPTVPPTVPVLKSHHLLGHLPAMRDDMLGLQLRALREVGDIARLRTGPGNVVMVSSPAYAQEVLTERQEDYEKSATLTVFIRPITGDGILSSQGSRHKRRRQIVAPAFQANRIARYHDTIVRETDRVLARFEPGSRLDFGEAMLHLTLEIVGATLFNANVQSDIDLVGRAVTRGSEAVTQLMRSTLMLPPSRFTAVGRKLLRAGAELDSVVYRILRERRASGEDPGDVLSMLLGARDAESGEGLSDVELRDEVMTLFLAGHETTANALTWSLALISRHPEVAARLAAEVDALDGRAPSFEDLAKLPYALAVFKEAMRLYPPAYLVGRTALTETRIGKHRLPRGQVVFVNIYGIHRRADLFPDPDAFKPERFLDGGEKRLPKGAFLPFGGGPRICVGNHFALMEAQLVLARLAQRFELAGCMPGALPEGEPLITLRPKTRIEMNVVPRQREAVRRAG
ncbi:MAG TPA: cytochrome P450, partial [Polyangiales bacterium]